MNSPVMEALAPHRQVEAEMFTRWCELKRIAWFPSQPGAIAAFIRDCSTLGIERLWPTIRELSEAHLSRGYPDPTAGGPVAAEINSISGVEPPRSWAKTEWPRFFALPYDLQLYVIDREKQRERVVGRAISEFGLMCSDCKTKITNWREKGNVENNKAA